MQSKTYDIITVGGGLGGSALAKAMAEHGARVLVVERERHFKDRVRGEAMHPWGVAEARALGIYKLLHEACGHEIPWRDTYLGSERLFHRDLSTTTPQRAAEFAFYHPTMQEVLLTAAAEAGAEIRRGARVRGVKPGPVPTVEIEHDGQVEEVRTRLVVGADGRASLVRKWAGFAARRDPERFFVAGVLFDDMRVSQDTAYIIYNPRLGQGVPLFPQGGSRVRVYFVYPWDAGYRLQGARDLPRLVAECVKTGAPAAFFAGAKVLGPLATFSGADTWVEHPYRQGVVLIGDAAAASDPSFGQGLALTVRDVRVLRDALVTQEDWEVAGHTYATEHDRYYGVIHTLDNWVAELFLRTGTAAEARRARALPLIVQDRSRIPDLYGVGPESRVDETVRQRFFGEE
jgi:2-polyprenyl-6-methoxyphenol hydroxylase-like FAD-dependent oxidoreductase